MLKKWHRLPPDVLLQDTGTMPVPLYVESQTNTCRARANAVRHGAGKKFLARRRIHSRRGEARRADRLPAGTFPLTIFLSDRRSRELRAGRRNPRKIDKYSRGARARTWHSYHCVAFRETPRRTLSQYRRCSRCRWKTARQVSQDAHPGRPALSREILFRAGRSRIPSLANRARKDRCLCLLGPMVSGSGATDGVARRGNHFLSDGHRLASSGEEGIRRGAAFGVGNDSAQPCNCEWLLCRGGEPHRS